MLEVGVLGVNERVELLGGELFETSPQGPLHWRYAQTLVEWLSDNRPQDTSIASNGPLRLSEREEPEPELFMYPRGMDVNRVRGHHTLLVVEVSHSSLRIDRAIKAPIYEGHDVREYWVVDVENRQTFVHKLGGNGYGEPTAIPFDQALTAPGGRPLVIADLTPPP